jgi:uncharacterized damage-inducible protein DinB
MADTSTDLRYPIGKYEPQPYSAKQHQDWLNDIQLLPKLLEQCILNLDEAQLQTPYREGGWTVHQLIHHVADSHANAMIRFKLGLTEDNPTIKPYDEGAWAKLNDVQELPINISFTLLHALHARWHSCIKNISGEQLQARSVVHPEHNKQMTLWFLLGMYAWHGKHHTAHISSLRSREGW